MLASSLGGAYFNVSPAAEAPELEREWTELYGEKMSELVLGMFVAAAGLVVFSVVFLAVAISLED